jgi:hypothetical protein
LLTLLLLAAALLLTALTGGWNRPRPSAPPDRQLDGPLYIDVPAGRQAARLVWQPAGAFTFEAVAAPPEGVEHNAYGLAFGALDPHHYTVFAVGSDGYLAVLQVNGEEESALLDWQSYPHVHRGREANRLRVACDEEVCRLWVNDEYVTTLSVPSASTGAVGVWGRCMEPPPARFRFTTLTLWKHSSCPTRLFEYNPLYNHTLTIRVPGGVLGKRGRAFT